MKSLKLDIEDDGTFNARVTVDGVVAATASGNLERCTTTGATRLFADALRVIGAQIWTTRGQSEIQESRVWNVQRGGFGISGHGWGFWLPNGTPLNGFESAAAAISASAKIQAMWPALISPPNGLYEAFQTDGEGWGFIDAQGILHATFPSSHDAQSVATKKRSSP